MYDNSIVFSIFLIFTGAAVLSTFALFTRQSLLVAYIILGLLLGPWGLKLVSDAALVKQIGDIGIIFLLFLLGLHLHPQNLWSMLRKVTWVALLSSALFASLGMGVGLLFGFSLIESVIIGAAMMFSSTIIGLKLLPSTVLHHQHTGEVMISILLMQDLIAIVVLLSIHGMTLGGLTLTNLFVFIFSLPVLLSIAFVFQRYILMPLFNRFDRVREYIFLLSIAWCVSLSELATSLGLTHEVGAFIAGVALAASSISLYIAESLKPVRDFFLVMFFFSVGASFNLNYLGIVLLPGFLLAALMLVVKPLTFRYLLHQVSESRSTAWEVGFRLGQVSEFSLLVAYIAANTSLVSNVTSYLIQATTIITFLVSSYIVVLKYPTPLAINDKLRRD